MAMTLRAFLIEIQSREKEILIKIQGISKLKSQ